jgi:acyl homoserine lactone synthase
MFMTIQPHEIADNSVLMTQMFKLRKRVFHDQLGWDVPVVGELEVDAYDGQNASYLIWCSDDRKTLYAMVRLMPTDGPTLLHDVFGPTHGHSAALIGASVWEGTRMCVDEAALNRDMPDMNAGEAFRLLLLALCEVSLAHGITRLVSNFEAPLSRIYRRAGLTYHLHGRADCYSERPVFCASFDVSPACLAQMRATIGVDLPLYRYSTTTTSLVATPAQVAEVA